jgi:hypothetical protein
MLTNRIGKVLLLFLGLLLFAGSPGNIHAQNSNLNPGWVPLLSTVVEPTYSPDGQTVYGAAPLAAIVNDPDPRAEPIRIPASDRALDPTAATASFNIAYVEEGGTDLWGERCYTFPDYAKAPIERAAAIWSTILQSNVPITVRMCWVSLTDSEANVLGYSGGQPQHMNFANAPRANTWFQASVANSIAGQDLAPNSFDMHIAMNRNFSWYYGIDGNTPADKHDFVTVMIHEIAHGLNFSGSMRYAGNVARYGLQVNNSGAFLPNIYDVFMHDGSGNALTNTSIYPNPSNGSTQLGSAVTSNNLWWLGTNATAANGGPVKMFAPSSWMGGSSYSHMDYDTYASTPNRLMVYAIGRGDSVHNPGSIVTGILKDVGWAAGGGTTDYQKAEILFNWAEDYNPTFFSPPRQPIQEYEGILFRYYPTYTIYLATYQGHFFMWYQGQWHHLGSVDEWLSWIQ